MEDGELIRAFQRGERERAFEGLYYRYRDWVHSLAFRFCGNQADALDVLQEAFAYFYRKLSEFELWGQLKTFFYPVVKHLALNRKAAARRVVPLEGDHRAMEGGGEHAEDLLAGLPEEQREVVWLRFVDEMDLKDIAETLGVPLGTVKSRLHTALSALRGRGAYT
jgi:RNA polymerase sigma-70 factor (ECF subfamily)